MDVFIDNVILPNCCRPADTVLPMLSSSIALASPLACAEESQTPLRKDRPPPAFDVEGLHRIFKLRDRHVTEVVHGLSAAAKNERISWMPFLWFMCGLADVRPLKVDSRAAATIARTIFDVFAEEKQQEVDLRALASGLSVSGRFHSRSMLCRAVAG